MSKSVKGLYRVLLGVVGPVMRVWTDIHVTGLENLPRQGGFLVTPNHISNVDPLCMAYFLVSHGYPVRFMAKSELFRVPLLGAVLRGLKMVSVDRRSPHPDGALAPARMALNNGECVAIYVEGTLTRDPQYWPMRAKTGAARLALDTGVPVIPIAQWGAQEILPRYTKVLNVRPGREIRISVLPAVDLSDLQGPDGSEDHAAVAEATRRIQRAITAGVEELRGEPAPHEPWDPDRMSGPDKKTLGRFSMWRRSLTRRGGARSTSD
ncbi:MAG: 1-acyl-sn-glycerol-3-phosphate acyltransferase [Propionibacterium sp.]|nr:1-acyl-sn-glycerol-3-phosphate acyltransferase [Propionibacterium sp.]MDN6794242.1 1-acyl-sn-glycerol-3-phosphate acyltransferase [Propionibacterium sp.]